MNNRMFKTGQALLNSQQIRRKQFDNQTRYVAQDVVALIGETQHPAELWQDLKQGQPQLRELAVDVEGLDTLDQEGIFHLIQVMPSDRAQPLRNWLAKLARQRLEESKNPELAILRTRRAYEKRGYSRDWIAKRLQSIGGRHELAGEWYRRGARDSDQFRALTNELLAFSFGMDVNTYRRFKGLQGTAQNLRDHMNDLELALVSLGETVAASLHRDRRSNGFAALEADIKDSGSVVATTRAEIERQTARPVVSASNRLRPRSQGRKAA